MRHPGAALFPVISRWGFFQQPRLFLPIERYLRSVGNWPRPPKNSPNRRQTDLCRENQASHSFESFDEEELSE